MLIASQRWRMDEPNRLLYFQQCHNFLLTVPLWIDANLISVSAYGICQALSPYYRPKTLSASLAELQVSFHIIENCGLCAVLGFSRDYTCDWFTCCYSIDISLRTFSLVGGDSVVQSRRLKAWIYDCKAEGFSTNQDPVCSLVYSRVYFAWMFDILLILWVTDCVVLYSQGHVLSTRNANRCKHSMVHAFLEGWKRSLAWQQECCDNHS